MSRWDMPQLDLEALKPKDPEQLRAARDVSDTAHHVILKMAAVAGAGLLAAAVLHPFKEWSQTWKEFWGAGMSCACIMSWLAAGSGLWAAVRTRTRYAVWALLISAEIAAVSTIYAYLVTFGGL